MGHPASHTNERGSSQLLGQYNNIVPNLLPAVWCVCLHCSEKMLLMYQPCNLYTYSAHLTASFLTFTPIPHCKNAYYSS